VRSEGETTLDALIEGDPVGELGAEVAERFGGRLPFLLKVLAAQKALSIQLHPDREQAQAGFAAEEARGVPRKARERVYVDDWPKPEILCALTPFEVLAGLRPAIQAADVLDGLGVNALSDLARGLRSAPEPATVGRVLAILLDWPDVRSRDDLVQRALKGAANAAARGGEYKAAYEAVGRIAVDHPGDIGLVCSLLMNHAVVEPGQALFMAAGGVHAYIRGTGVELMANSDNVIRAGLTPKHIDIPELVRVLDPAVPVPILTARRTGPGVEEFDTPVPEFRLRRLTPEGASIDIPAPGQPRILLCIDGEAVVSTGGQSLTLGRGQSCYLSTRDAAATMSGNALLFLASPGD
jgi:mannose-6-phosphate isomerase